MYFEIVVLLNIVSPARSNTALWMSLLLRSIRGLFIKVRVQDIPALTTSDT